MKKLIIYIILIVILVFLLPMLFAKKFELKEVSSIKEIKENVEYKEENTENYIYSNYGEVRVFHTKTNEIETMQLDDYLLGVVSAEMPANFELEALKAQAVVARTYTVYTIENSNNKHGEAQICDDSTCCQAWISKEDRMEKWEEDKRDENWKKIEQAVFATKGEIITYKGKTIDAFFHSNSGGKTEEVSNVWGGTDLPYLKSVETAGEDAYMQYASEVNISKRELENKIKEKYPQFIINYEENDCIKILEYTKGDRVKTIKIGNTNLSGVETREIFGLKSANFEFEIEGENIHFKVKGYGHGVGMSQTGADSLAKEGKNYVDIIKHFYSDVEVVNI